MTFGFNIKWPDFKQNTTWGFNLYSDKDITNVGSEKYISDTFFNDYIIESSDTMYYNPSFKVILKEYRSNVTVRNNGVMQEIDLANGNHAFKVVFSPAIQPGELKIDTKYTILFPRGIVGIDEYQYYIERKPRPDGTKVSKSDCTVNRALDFSYTVNNEIASDIDTVATDNRPAAIYTLQGTRVGHMKAPGIYIVNGRKVVVK